MASTAGSGARTASSARRFECTSAISATRPGPSVEGSGVRLRVDGEDGSLGDLIEIGPRDRLGDPGDAGDPGGAAVPHRPGETLAALRAYECAVVPQALPGQQAPRKELARGERAPSVPVL